MVPEVQSEVKTEIRRYTLRILDCGMGIVIKNQKSAIRNVRISSTPNVHGIATPLGLAMTILVALQIRDPTLLSHANVGWKSMVALAGYNVAADVHE